MFTSFTFTNYFTGEKQTWRFFTPNAEAFADALTRVKKFANKDKIVISD